MARFDFYESPAGSGYVLDVQADLMSALNTRVVVPLMPIGEAPCPAGRLNPVFEISGERFAMTTQFLASIPASELKRRHGSLAHERDVIVDALDMLFSGF